MEKNIYLLTIILIVLSACGNQEKQPETRVNTPVNYMVLLDLSDRLLSQGQASRDIEIIQIVFQEFNSEVRRNLVINSHDKFQVIIAPQKGITYDAHMFENALFIDMGSMNSGEKINNLVEFGNTLPAKLNELYLKAGTGQKTTDYQGAAIWQFFNENLEYLIDKKSENYLVVITDGYFDLEDYGNQLPDGNRFPTTSFLSSARNNISWQEILEDNDMGILPVKKDFNSLKVVVTELNPKYDFQYEADMLTYVWTKWCKEMNTGSINIIAKTSLPQTKTLLKNKLSLVM
jgi:hypothetical protein